MADLELRYLRMTVLPPIGKQSRFPALQLSVIHARERNALRKGAPHVRNVLGKLARVARNLARASDPPPGNTVTWRGMTRLTDIQLGYELAMKRCE